MLSVGVTGLRRETGRQWHLAVINEVTFPTAPAAIEKNLFHFKVTSGGMCGRSAAAGGRTTGWFRQSVGRSVRASKSNTRNWSTVSGANNLCGNDLVATNVAFTSGAH